MGGHEGTLSQTCPFANSEKTALGSGTGPSQSKDLKASADCGAAHLSLASVAPQTLEPACPLLLRHRDWACKFCAPPLLIPSPMPWTLTMVYWIKWFSTCVYIYIIYNVIHIFMYMQNMSCYECIMYECVWEYRCVSLCIWLCVTALCVWLHV